MLFRYLQLCYAFNTQFGSDNPKLAEYFTPIYVMERHPKGIISTLYNSFLTHWRETVAERSKIKWESLVGNISKEDWEEALETSIRVSLRYPERATQLYIVYLSYLSTTQVTKYCPGRHDIYPKCSQQPGSLFHLMWQCPQIQGFRVQVVRFLQDVMGTPIPLTPQCCVLAILEILDLSRAQKMLSHETLFQARKLIARNWMNNHIPSLSEWIHSFMKSLPCDKLIFVHWGTIEKFYKIWTLWY